MCAKAGANQTHINLHGSISRIEDRRRQCAFTVDRILWSAHAADMRPVCKRQRNHSHKDRDITELEKSISGGGSTCFNGHVDVHVSMPPYARKGVTTWYAHETKPKPS